MRRKVTIGMVVVLIIAAAVLFIHPVKVLSSDAYRYRVFVSQTATEVDRFAPTSGGWRAYLDDANYIWFSDNSYEYQPDTTPFGIKWGWPWEKPILKMGVS